MTVFYVVHGTGTFDVSFKFREYSRLSISPRFYFDGGEGISRTDKTL